LKFQIFIWQFLTASNIAQVRNQKVKIITPTLFNMNLLENEAALRKSPLEEVEKEAHPFNQQTSA